MAEETVSFSEILVAPIQTMLEEISRAVAGAQVQLDKNIHEMKLDESLKEIGYQPNWYQMQQIDIEMKLAVHYEEKKESKGKGSIFISPFNAKYQNAFSYSAEGASTLKMKIVPVPPAAFEVK